MKLFGKPIHPSIHRFIRYVAVGVSTFLFDLSLLYVAVSYWHVAYYVATPCAFLIGVSCGYVLSRHFVFRETVRSWHGGYAYFIGIALVGAVVTTGSVALLVSVFGLYFLFARIVVAGFVGAINYVANLYFNFAVAGKHS